MAKFETRQKGIYLYIASTTGPSDEGFTTETPAHRLEDYDPGATKQEVVDAIGKVIKKSTSTIRKRTERSAPSSSKT